MAKTAKDDPLVFASERGGGRSSGVLHADRDCYNIRDVPDEFIVARPRSDFYADQPMCRRCADDVEERTK